jgi:methionyl-tRNA synthetase
VPYKLLLLWGSICEPFLPFTSEIVKNVEYQHQQLNLEFEDWTLLPAGHKIGQAELLF